MSDKFPTKNDRKEEAALSLLLFNFALEYAFGMVQENRRVWSWMGPITLWSVLMKFIA